MFKSLSVVLALAACAHAGSFIPTLAPCVTQRKEAAKADFAREGLVAFVWTWPRAGEAPDSVDGKPLPPPVRNHSIQLDIRNVETGDKYRFELTSEFYNVVSLPGYVKKIRQDVISDSVTLYALPPGRYVPVYAQIHRTVKDMSGAALDGNEFTVEAGRITSFGTVRLRLHRAFLKSGLDVATLPGSNIEEAIRGVEDARIAALPVTSQPLNASFPSKKKIRGD